MRLPTQIVRQAQFADGEDFAIVFAANGFKNVTAAFSEEISQLREFQPWVMYLNRPAYPIISNSVF
jgi:vacuolar-type H+-ATPase subunit B/Vma2